jgi:hypothetical protein
MGRVDIAIEYKRARAEWLDEEFWRAQAMLIPLREYGNEVWGGPYWGQEYVFEFYWRHLRDEAKKHGR